MANGHRNNKKRAVAFAAVAVAAMMLITGLAFVNSADTSSAEPVTQDVTYHVNGGSGADVTISYVGIVATEYNPTYWVGSFDNCPGKWTGPSQSHSYGGSIGTITVTMVFAGWSVKATPTAQTDIYDPGDVIPSDVHDLYAFWAFPDVFSGGAVTQQATSGTPTAPTAYGNTTYADRMYTTQYYISDTRSFSGNLNTGSYRSQSAYGSGNAGTINISGNITASGNVVIDNVTFTSISAGGNHGYGTNAGIYGNAHKLILGTGIVSSFNNNSPDRAPQVYGGGTGNSTGTAYSQKEIVANDEQLNGMKFNMGSFVIIHSGTYYNVMAGGRQTMGSANSPLSTYLVFKKATVIDSVGGGNATSSGSYPIYGSTTGLNQIDPYQGGTFIYAIGLTTLGDSWASQETGYSQDITTNEGANFQGGCSVSNVNGSTHVFVSGNSSVWDVQGGGRAGSSKCAFTYVEISGNAEVRHAACGLVTDGTSSANTCAKGTKMVVADNPHIAMLFGAGYDTWANPTASNMTEGKTIEVDIRGGTIGFVYGGGYRGTVGSQGNQLTIDVNISGGDILYDVFGGGRGGVDKMLRTVSGRDTSSSGYKDSSGRSNSTGQSVIYGDVNVTITGTAHIHGNVYAGGESVPKLTRYYGYSEFGNNDNNVNVAEVVGKTSVTVSGNAIVNGSVYGSGKGISILNGSTIDGTYHAVTGDDVADYYTKNLVLSKKAGDDGWKFLDWYNHSSESGSIQYDTSNNSLTKYLEYARTNQKASVTIQSGTIAGSVYGGGAYSKSLTDSEVTVSGGQIGTDVYGGGLGRLTYQSVAGNSSVIINNGTVIGDVYGGSAYGIVAGNSSVTLTNDVEGDITINGSVFGAGLGDSTYSSVVGNSSVIVKKGTMDTVYGGSAYGIVSGNSVVLIENGNITGCVYGGGLGTPEVNSNLSNTSVTIEGGTIANSVYGGCAWGITVKDSMATVSGGTIGGSLYGGGLGTVDINSVLGNSTAVLSGGSVAGDVFGGCAYGITVGNSYATVSGGTVGVNVFAGGLGTAKHVSVKGKRYLLVTGGTVMGSVYAGSSLGDDASSEAAITAQSKEDDSSAYLAVSAGRIEGSVYGGGYKGSTTGTTYVYIGYSDFNGTKSTGQTIYIGNSVYGGGDVGELAPGQPMFVDTMVFGGSQVYVNGNNAITFTGTISAAGNSCLTKGETSIVIDSLVIDDQIESIHRADTVTLISSNLKLSGKINGSGDNTKYAFYGIEHLNLQKGTTIYLYAPMDTIGEFSSLNASGGLTKPSAPMNTLYICNGTMFEVRKGTTYGNVNGYTLLSIRTVENYYGALTLGSTESPGGFVIERNGSYVVADISDFSNVRCWFISGSLQTVTSSTLLYDAQSGSYVDDGGHYINIPTLSKTTKIRYTGGYFSSDAGYVLVNTTTPEPNKYSVRLGTNTEGRQYALLLNDGNGMFLPTTIDATETVVEMGNRTDQPCVQIIVYGHNDNNNRYLGYAIIYLQEVVAITYIDPQGHEVTDHLVQNKIEVRVDIYTEGTTTDIEDTDASIRTVKGNGQVDIIIPSRLSDHTVYLTDVTTDLGDIPMYVSAVKNNGGTTGWNYPLNSFRAENGFHGSKEIQSLTGAFIATLRISVSDFNIDGTKTATLRFKVCNELGVEVDDFTVTLDIKKHAPVNVKFVDDAVGIDRPPYSFDYGDTITEADCPHTLENFVGWYTDANFVNQFNFNTPLISDITLYARYMYTVTFDYQNGITSTMYVQITQGGVVISEPDTPSWDGYVFNGWFKDLEWQESWAFYGSASPDKVTDNITLYAKWIGKEYTVTFKYTLPGGSEQTLMDGDVPYSISVRYGGVYGAGIDTATQKMQSIIAGRTDVKFVRWQLSLGVSTIGIYSDTICKPPSGVQDNAYSLVAEFTNDAINIVLNKNTSDATAVIEAPVNYLLYTDAQGYYTLVGNNATRTGYRIIGWAFVPGENPDYYVDIGSELRFKADDPTVGPYIVNDTLTLYAVWDQIKYTITLVQPMGGQIRATLKIDDVTYTYYDEFEATYGNVITLNYSDTSGAYQFAKWTLSGQGVFDNAQSASTTMTVIGSCAIYAQLRALSAVNISLYLNGGSSATPEIVDLWLCDNGSTYAMLDPADDPVQDGSGKYYRVYSLSSKLGTFDISILGSDGKQYKLGSVGVFEDLVQATVYAVTVTSEVQNPALIGLPLYAKPGDTISGFTIPEGYEINGKLKVDANGELVELNEMSYTVSEHPTTGVVFKGSLKIIVWTVTLSGDTGFTFKVGDEFVTQVEYDYGSLFGTLPTVYDPAGYVAGSDASAYIMERWCYDALHNLIVSETDKVTGSMTIYAYTHLKGQARYLVDIYMMEIGGEYPATPSDTVEQHGLSGQLTTYNPTEFPGFTIATDPTVYTNFMLTDGMKITIQYARLYHADPEIKLGTAQVSGTAELEGWNLVQGSPNKLTKAKIYYGETITLPTVTVVGYTNTGWTVGGAAYEQATYTADTIVAGELVFPDITAVLTINKWTLQLDVNESRIKFSDESTLKEFTNVTYGTVINTIEGYEQPPNLAPYIMFIDWIDEQGNTFDVTGGMPDRNLTLRAHWDIAKFTVTYTNNGHMAMSGSTGGKLFDSGTKVEYGSVVISVLIDTPYKYDSHTITGSAPGTLVKSESDPRHTMTYTFTLTEDTVFDLQCVESKFRVAYYLDGNAEPISDEQVFEGTIISHWDYKKNGYNLHGWYINAAYTVDADYTVISPLTADWSFYGYTTPKVYTVSFLANGGTGTTESVDMTFDSYKELTANGFVREGAIFLGWSKDAEKGVEYNDGENVMNVSPTGDNISLYAVWLMVTPYSGSYDALAHAPSVTGLNAAGGALSVYFSFTELNESNYETGTLSPETKTNVGIYTYYYYAKDTKVGLSGSVTSTISTVPLTVTADDRTITYGDAKPAYSVSYTGLVGGETASVLGGSLVLACEYAQFSPVGDYVIVPSGLTSGNYDIAFVNGKLTVQQKTVTLNWTGTALTYNAHAQKPVATAGGLVNGDACVVTVTGEQTNIGTYTATATALSNGNYKLPAANTVQFVIAPAPLEIVGIDVPDKVYNGNVEAEITGTAELSGVLEGDVLVLGGNPVAAFADKNVGVWTVSFEGYTITGDSIGNYTWSQPSFVREITKKSVLIKSADAERTYNGQPLTANSVRVEDGGFVGNEGFTYTVTGTLTDAGIVNNTFTYQLNANTNADNYLIAAVPGTLTVYPASITNITYKTFSGDYDGSAHPIISEYNATTVNNQPLTWYFSSDGVNWSETMITVTVSGDSGLYYIKVTAPNHSDEVSEELISVGIIIIDAPAISGSVYTGSLYQPTVPQDPLYAVESNPGGTDVGTYYVTLVLTNPNNYEWKNSDNEYITIPYDITKANASAALTANTLTYNKSAQALIKADAVTGGTIGYSLTEGGVYTADIPAETNAGDYTVYWKITGDSNHFDADGSVPVKIMKATPVLVANVPTLRYNGAEQELLSVAAPSEEISVLYSLNGGAFGTTVPTGTNAGNYTVSYKSEATANYNASVVGTTAPSVTVAIAKAVYDRSHIHFVDASFQYDAVAHTIEITTDAGYPLPAEITPVYTNNTRIEVGNSNATVTFNVGSNYEAITGFTATLTIYVLDIQYTATGYDGTYDATAHAAMTVAVATPATGAVITYSATQYGTYTEECPTVTNAGNGTVWFKIVALGYTTVNASRTYNVAKITISVSSASDSKAYDTEPLTAAAISLDDGQLAPGHTLDGSATGIITNVGSTSNPFTVAVMDGTTDVSSNYNISKNPGTLTVVKAKFTYIHYLDDSIPYDGQQHSLLITVDAGHPLPSEITPVYDGNTGTQIGIYEATVTFTVSSNYEEIGAMHAVMTIYDSDIEFTAVVYSATYDGQSHPAIAINVATPDSTVAYSYDGETYVPECPTVLAAGTTSFWYKIEAYGHNTVNNRATASVSLRPITVTSASDSKAYDTEPLTAPTASLTDGSLVGAQTLSCTVTGTITNAGSTANVFTVAVMDGTTDVTSNYDITKVEGQLTVRKAVFDRQYIHFDDTQFQYDGTMKTLLIWTDEGHDLPSEITPNYSNNYRIIVGTNNASVSFSVSNNYEAIEGMTAKLTVYESTLDCTYSFYTGTYDGQAHNMVTVTVNTPGATVSYSLNGSSYSAECPTITNAGTSTVWFKVELLGYTTISQYKAVTVSKFSVSITSESATKTYDGLELSRPALLLGGDLPEGHYPDAEAQGKITNAGSVQNAFTPLIRDAQGNNVTANYDVHKTVGTLTVNKANVTVNVLPSEPFEFDGSKKFLKYGATGLAQGDEIEATLSYTKGGTAYLEPTLAGTYDAKVSTYRFLVGSGNNYNVDYQSSSGVLVIVPRTIQAPAADTTEFVYDGTQKVYAIYEDAYFRVQGNAQVNAGSYTVTVSLRDKNNNAWSTGTSDDLTYDFVIGKRSLRVVADQISKVYGDADPTFTYTVYGEAEGEVAGFVGALEAASHTIGTNDISIGTLVMGNNGAFKTSNYVMTYEGAGRFTITPLMVDVPEAAGEFGVLYYTGDVVVAYADGTYYTVTGGSATEVGNYVATLTLKDTVNYVWSDTRNNADRELQYRIVLAKINVLFTPYTGVYDGLYHEAVVINDADGSTVYYGFEMMGWTTEVPTIKDVSENRTLYIRAEKANHEVFYAEVPYSIAKARLDVYADDKIITLSDDLPEFTFRAEGFVNGETIANLTCEIIFGTPYQPGQGWGTYAITCVNGPVDANYEIFTHDGVLTVAMHKVTVVWVYTEYIYTKTVQQVRVQLMDEDGNLTDCTANVTDLDGRAVEFRDLGDYIATAVLPEGYVLDPADTAGLSAKVTIVGNEAFEFNYEVVVVVILIVLIAAELIYTMFVRKH